MTDEERIDWLAELARRSSTGISIECVNGQFRFMSRHCLDDFKPTIREAIDHGIKKRQIVPNAPEQP